MTKKILALALALIFCLGMTACGSQSQEADTQETGTPNPMVEVSHDEMVEATTVDIDAPADATDVKYFTIDNGEGNFKTAHVAFKYNDKSFFYRGTAGLIEITDETGLYGDWTETKEVNVAYNVATLEIADDCAGMYWYDAVPGVNYSLGCEEATTEDEMVTLANEIFVPLQGNAGAEMEGMYINGNAEDRDMITININNGGDTYDVKVEIHRLCEMKGQGNIIDGSMEMVLEDPNGEEMKATFYPVEGEENMYNFKVTDSSWDLLPTGEEITGFSLEVYE